MAEAPPWVGRLPLVRGRTASCGTAKDGSHLELQKESMQKNNNSDNDNNSPTTFKEGGTSPGYPHHD